MDEQLNEIEKLINEENKEPCCEMPSGCGRGRVFYSFIEHLWFNCGEKLNSGKLILCKKCTNIRKEVGMGDTAMKIGKFANASEDGGK